MYQVKKTDQLTDAECALEIQEILKELPAYCTDYFDNAHREYSLKDKLVHARDIYVFLNYLQSTSVLYQNVPLKEVPVTSVLLISPTEIDGYMKYLDEFRIHGFVFRADNYSKARKISTLSFFYSFIQKNEKYNRELSLVTENKAMQENSQVKYTEYEHMQALLSMIQNDEGLSEHQKCYQKKIKERDEVLALLIMGTKLSLSEISRLNLDNVEFKEDGVCLNRGKKEADYVYLNERTSQALERYLIASEGEEYECSPRWRLLRDEMENALFLSLRGTRMSAHSIKDMLMKYQQMVLRSAEV